MNDPVHLALSRANPLLFAAAVAGLAVALFDFFWWGNGIHGSAGALLVVISSALLAGATASLMFAAMSQRLVVTLTVLIVLGIIGTGLAAYMLEANVLLAVTGLMLIGWIAQRFQGPVTPSRTQNLRLRDER